MRLIFMGSPQLACPSLAGLVEAGLDVPLVVTQPDRAAGRGLKLTPSPVAMAAAGLGIPAIKPEKIKNVVEQLAAVKPDYLVVVAFGQILPQAVLDLAPAINLHTSLLPALRGAAPINRAIMNGLTQTGITTMLMDKGLDTGPVLLQKKIAIAAQDTAMSLGGKMADMGPSILLETLRGLQNSTITPVPQNNALASYAPMLSREEAALNWNNPAFKLDWQTRGLFPWPGVHAFTPEGERIKLFPPTGIIEDNHGHAPGVILDSSLTDKDDMLVVACGTHALGFAAAQAPGKKRVSGREMARWLSDRGIHHLRQPLYSELT